MNVPTEAIQLVTPAVATEWLSNFNYRHQRAIRSYHVSSLARMMAAGSFRQKTQVNFCRLGDHYHLTNGQHTLSAIVASGIAQTLSVIVTNVSCEKEVADDFSRHDTHLTRQLSDAMIAHEVHNELGVTPTVLNTLAAACMFYAYLIGERTSKGATQSTHDEKLEIIKRHGRLAKAVSDCFEGFMNLGFLTRKATFSCAMFCFSADKDLSHDFWRSVASDDGLKIADPRKTIREWLRERVTPGGTYQSRMNAKVAADHEMVKAISVAWNAWVDCRELKVIKIDRESDTAEFKRIGSVRVKGKV